MISIETKNLTVTVNRQRILENISFRIDGPGLCFILGRNGSGKSTLLRALAGLIPHEGQISINDKPIESYNRNELTKIIGYVWQNPFYGFFESTVEREIRFILKNIGLDVERSRFSELVDFFGVKKFLNRSPFTLSGGEAKRVCICSVLIANQQIYLFDEPEGELDYYGLERLIEFVRKESSKKLIVIATHNTLLAHKLKGELSKILIVHDGRLVGEYGSSILVNKDFLTNVGIVPVYWWLE